MLKFQVPAKTNYTLHGKHLKQVSSATILGVTCQDNCEYQEHINNTATKGNQLLGFLLRNLKNKNTKVKTEGYLTLVRPSLEYASNIWDPHHQTDKEKLEKIQRLAARFAFNDYKTSSSVSAMLNTLNWPLLEEQRKEMRLKMLQKIINDEVAVNHNNTLKPATSRSRRTHNFQLRTIASSRDYRRESFFPQAIREWTCLKTSSLGVPYSSLELYRVTVTQQYFFFICAVCCLKSR